MTDAGRVDDRSPRAGPIDGDVAAAAAYLLVITAGVGAVAVGADPYWLTLPVWFAALLPGTELLGRHVTRLGARGRRHGASISPGLAGAGAARAGRSERGIRPAPARSSASGSVERARAFEDAAVGVLRERYARGDLDETELEARLELLVDLEDGDASGMLERARDR